MTGLLLPGNCLQICHLLQAVSSLGTGAGFYLSPCPRPGSGTEEMLTGTVPPVPVTLSPEQNGSQHGPGVVVRGEVGAQPGPSPERVAQGQPAAWELCTFRACGYWELLIKACLDPRPVTSSL